MPGMLSMFEELRVGLTQAIVSCRAEQGEKAVHGLRAGTRRLDALLRKVLEDHPGAVGLHRESKRAMKQLGKIRKMAGSVRDLDVQRELAEEIKEELSARKSEAVREDVAEEYEQLDGYLKRRRRRNADALRKGLTKCELKMERALERITEEIEGLTTASPSPLSTARGWTRRVGIEGEQLNEGNLHEYRKKTKAARYVAELQKTPTAKRLAAELRGVQDAIGQWHDWELLSELAKDFVGEDSLVVGALIKKRISSFRIALRKARG